MLTLSSHQAMVYQRTKTQLMRCIATGNAVEAEQALQELRQSVGEGGLVLPDVVLYTMLMRCYTKQRGKGSTTEARRVLRRMQAAGVNPNRYTFNTLLTAYAATGDTTRADALLAQMRQQDVTPDVVTFNTLLQCYCQSGHPGPEPVLQAMAPAGVNPDVITFNTLIAHCARQKDLVGAHRWLAKMQQAGIAPDCSSFNHLLQCCVRCRNSRQAEHVVQRLMPEAGVSPTTVTYNTLMGCLPPTVVLAQLRAAGLAPDAVTQRILTRCPECAE